MKYTSITLAIVATATATATATNAPTANKKVSGKRAPLTLKETTVVTAPSKFNPKDEFTMEEMYFSDKSGGVTPWSDGAMSPVGDGTMSPRRNYYGAEPMTIPEKKALTSLAQRLSTLKVTKQSANSLPRNKNASNKGKDPVDTPRQSAAPSASEKRGRSDEQKKGRYPTDDEIFIMDK